MTAVTHRTWRLVGTVLAVGALLAAMVIPRLLVTPWAQLAPTADTTYRVGQMTLQYRATPGPAQGVIRAETRTTLPDVAQAGSITVETTRQLMRTSGNPVTARTAKERTFAAPELTVFTATGSTQVEYVSEGLDLAWPGGLNKKSYYIADPLIDDLFVVDFLEKTTRGGIDAFVYTGGYTDVPAAAPLRTALDRPELTVTRQWTYTVAPRTGHILSLTIDTQLRDGAGPAAPVLFSDAGTLDESTQSAQVQAAQAASRAISVWGTWVPLVLTIGAGLVLFAAWRQPARLGRQRLAQAVAP